MPIGKATNNIAEYTALIYALQEALVLKAEAVSVKTDSELLHHQIRGIYKVRDQNLKFLYGQIQHLKRGFRRMEIMHIPREKNQEADRLAKKAIQDEQAKMVAPMLNIGEESPSSRG